MNKPTLREHLRYRFDGLMSKGTPALIAGLALVSAFVVIVFSALIYVSGVAPAADDGQRPALPQIIWMSLMRTLDAGTMGGDAGSWGYLFAMLGVTLGGVFIISTLIGVLTSGIEARIEELRKGRSRVIESGHTVILGWSPHVFTIVSELVEANANQRRGCVVVLGAEDKVTMEDAIRAHVPDTKNTRVVCRTGDPTDLADLAIVGVDAARSIVVLAAGGDAPDAQVIKTLLAITNDPQRKPEPYHLVAELRDAKNQDVARLAGKGEATFVLVGDLLSRITVQTCRQSGLSVVYTELLDFGGDEIYLKEEPSLVGKRFFDASLAYEDSALMGVRKKDGRVVLNPPPESLVEAGDSLIAISEDDDTVVLSGRKNFGIDPSLVQKHGSEPRKPEQALILGWNWRVPSLIAELDKYVAPGSSVTVLCAHDVEAGLGRVRAGLERQKLLARIGDATDRSTLESLDPSKFDHIIVVSDEAVSHEQADARSLITLLHLRDMADRQGARYSIVSEILDVRNRVLADVTRADDFIVSDKLVSLMLAQVSENKDLKAVFEDLFSPEGSEIYLKPVEHYVVVDKPMNFYTVMYAAARQKQVAIGYRRNAIANRADQEYGVVVNPTKSDLITFTAGDKVIVLAED